MSYNPVSTSDSRSSSPVPFSQQQQHHSQQRFRGSHPLTDDHRSSEDNVVAPGSPYVDLLNKSFATDQDLGRLPITGHQPAEDYNATRNPFEQQPSFSSSSSSFSPPLSPYQQQQKHQARSILQKNQERERGSFSSQQQQAYYYQEPSSLNLDDSHHSYKQQQQDRQSYLAAELHPPRSSFAQEANMMRPPYQHGSGTASTVGSIEGRDLTDNNSTHRSLSAHQLRPTGMSHSSMDPNTAYNMTQSDMTLEGLAERWQAYQAWWAKQYKDLPFYRLWTKSKWILLFSVLLLMAYSAAAMAVSLGYIFGRFENSPVVMEFHGNIIYITLAGSALALVTAVIGFIGIVRENRIWLSYYALLLWPVFCLYISVGYIAFRRSKNHLRNHLRDEWMHDYTRDQRLLVQRNLKCCGYLSPLQNAEYDLRCFPMINLPGCIHKYNLYEDKLLTTVYTSSFSLVLPQLFVMIVALLCSNHVDAMLRSGRPGLKSFKEQ
ncbi:hypothetical protein EMPS_10151 [Entomortierella parvispora]|uniref:Tetraspanin Tsp2 n=1 Tax=Entomortierella parvispora TaxID=205924 RepID=A0A9P3HK92_9FUNG|nr:hypothetical protein EMPS_10151 [Entomortierella parvispora]